MSTSLWLLWVVFALILGAFSTVIWGNFQNKKGYREGYSNGYQKGANDQYKGDYKRRLLDRQQRIAAKEKQDATTDTERSSGPVQGSVESGDRIIGSGESGLFSNDADSVSGPVA